MRLRAPLALAALAALMSVPALASAELLFEFGTNVSDGPNPGGNPPWAVLDCDDSGDDTVVFTLTFSGDANDGEFLTELNLNFDGDVSGLSFVSGDPSVTGVDIAQNGITDSGYIFDIRVSFETSNSGGLRIGPGDSVSFTLEGDGVDCSDFNVLSGVSGDKEPVFALLHIQGTGEDNEDSTKIAPPIPEPATMGALAIGALGLLARRRRK